MEVGGGIRVSAAFVCTCARVIRARRNFFSRLFSLRYRSGTANKQKVNICIYPHRYFCGDITDTESVLQRIKNVETRKERVAFCTSVDVGRRRPLPSP